MSEYDDIDALTGGKAIDPMNQGMPAFQVKSYERIKPAKEQKFQGGNSASKISADPQNETVELIISALDDNKESDARLIAEQSDAPEFLDDFITEYVKNGGQDGKNWMYVRRIHAGAKGKKSPVTVELSYDADGDLNVVSVPKNMIYAVDMRSWKNSNLLPTPKTDSTPSPTPNPAESGDGPDLNPPPANESSNPSNPNADGVPPIDENNPLAELIGGTMVAGLKQLGLLDGVKIADTSMTNFRVISGTAKPYKIIGDNDDEMEIGNIVSRSSFGPQGQKGNFTPFSAENMGEILYESIASSIESVKNEGNVSEMVEQLSQIRKHMDALSRVFGFDDPKQLEAFFCAWLMKDSTCRLSGIPGTGKTTVINSAATLLANSYGFNVAPRYVAKKNTASGKPHSYYIFPAGMSYAVDYSDKNQEAVRREWEDWRFTTWEEGIGKKSGAYLYDFRFLQRKSDNGYVKHSMSPEAFAEILLETPVIGADGNMEDTITAKAVKYSTISALFAEHGANVPSEVSEKQGFAHILGTPLFTDAGGNEGWGLRDFLLEHFYDNRLGTKRDYSDAKLDLISSEMLHECGIAKIDYDKRAEEILYGVEIRQITEQNQLTKKTVASYSFDPTPRPVVTQPVKFFNEANRSGSGVEDAILGLIAEKTVEYRGQTFTSPSFVAWMDTNPHQKGNDLAFVDRIDMELLFGTLSLGGRFNTLLSRYATGAKGSTPEIQLIKRMLPNKGDEKFISPMRFKHLSKAWRTIGDMPFNSSGAGEDKEGALLDISLLSVLFTQRWMIQGLEDDFYGGKHIFKDDNDVFASPLADISTTTNSQFESIHADWWKLFGHPDTTKKTQAPVLITRMLGFRFSNSLIKMTRAMAFLRGKDHVTRQEVLDALPYCLGHRLGPAREGEDPKGRDIGIMREGMTVANEQDFVREIILNGYVLRNTESLMGGATNRSLMDLWDSFIRNCRSYLESTDAYWKYEQDVLLSIKSDVRNKSSTITPVHWSIATMIVENQKRMTSYKDRVSRYQERLQRPASKEGTKKTDAEIQKKQLMADVSIAQFIKIRGEIASDPLLFSDDRADLLGLADSKISAIGGNVLQATKAPMSCNFMAVAPTFEKASIGPYYNESKSFDAFAKNRGGAKANEFRWRCYGDAMGVWGRMITNAQNNKPVAKLGAGGTDDFLNVAGADFDANQTIGFTHQFTIPKKGDAVKDSVFTAKMETVLGNLTSYADNGGVLIGEKGTDSYGKIADFNSLQEYQDNALVLLNNWLSRPSNLPTGQTDATVKSMMKKGYNACFRANHAAESVDGSMNLNLPNGTTTTIKGDDDLRLWLCMRVIQGDNTTDGKLATIGFYIGITSACMRPSTTSAGAIIKDTDGNPVEWEVLPFDADETYWCSNYSDNASWEGSMYQDIGNLTIKDYREYVRMCLEAINSVSE